MAHRNREILDNPMKFPWWVSAILAGAVYVLSVYVLPGVTLASPILRDLPSGVARVRPTLSLLLLIVAAVSALFQFRRGRLLERKTGHGSVGALSWRQFVSQVSEAFSRKGFMVLNYSKAARTGLSISGCGKTGKSCSCSANTGRRKAWVPRPFVSFTAS